jgi:large subunit ribosomal protein L32
MAVPKQRVSSARKAQRNNGKFIRVHVANKCEKCEALKLPHRICTSCYFYNGIEFTSLKPKPKIEVKKSEA